MSFNALHWIPEQERALQSIFTALKGEGTAQLRVVPKGPRKSLEDVVEETRNTSKWNAYFTDFHDPYLRLTPEQYTELAQHIGFRIERVRTDSKSWDFKTRSAFEAFGQVTFAEWTKMLAPAEQPAFVTDVLDHYTEQMAANPAEANTFKFYQMDVTLRR